MPKPITRAQALPRLAEPRPRRAAMLLLKALAAPYLHLGLGYGAVRLIGTPQALKAFRDFREGESRLLVTFRHAYGDEPQLLAYAATLALPKAARRAGIRRLGSFHLHFVHGYEVPLWSGAVVRWLLPRIGALPVHHERMDSAGIGRLRSILLDGEYPLALAPEGQVSYTSSSVPRLEAGFARLAFWCAGDLRSAGRKERVIVLPVSIHHRYRGERSFAALDRIIGALERELGLRPAPGNGKRRNLEASPMAAARLRGIADAAVSAAEAFYTEISGSRLPRASGLSLDERFGDVVESALAAGERMLGLEAQGDIPRRFYRIRHQGWDRIYRADLEDLPKRSGLGRALLDREAGEAWYAMRHMELADLGYYLRFSSLSDDASLEELIETAMNYRDLVSRLEGGAFVDRPAPPRREAVLVFGEPLDATSELEAYGSKKKETIAAFVAGLAERYGRCVEDFHKEFEHAR